MAVSLTLLYAPMVAALLFTLYAFAADELLELAESHANAYLDELESILQEPANATRADDLARLAQRMTSEDTGYWLADATGARLMQAGAIPDGDRITPAERSVLRAVRMSRRDRLLDRRVLPSGQLLTLSSGVGGLIEERDELQVGFWITLGMGLVLVALASIAATRRALSPLRAATRATEEVDLDSPGARLPLRGTSDDVDRHARAVNQVLDRLESGLARIRAFGDDVAHELRTPINRIMNVAEVASLEGENGESARDALEKIRQSADQMSGIVDSLLMLARAAEGRLRVERTQLQLTTLLSTLDELYRPACEERGVRLEVGTPNGSRSLDADPTLLVRALANLLDNALAHTPSGGSIRVDPIWRDTLLTLRVSDTGSGIPETDLEHIFDRFVRLDPSRSGPGSGLGLPIARMIARAHGGDLVAAPSGSGGALFLLSLDVS